VDPHPPFKIAVPISYPGVPPAFGIRAPVWAGKAAYDRAAREHLVEREAVATVRARPPEAIAQLEPLLCFGYFLEPIPRASSPAGMP